MFLGLRTVSYPAPDLEASKRWFSGVLGQEPYFDKPFSVGFEVGGYELGLDPNADSAAGPVTYWGVEDAEAALARLLAAGAAAREAVRELGDGIRTGSVLEPGGSVLGVIENPTLQSAEPAAPEAPHPHPPRSARGVRGAPQ